MYIQFKQNPQIEKFTTHQLGNIAVGNAHAFFTRQGWMVASLLNDTKEYDCIVDTGEQVAKVQIKYTNVKCFKTNHYIASIGNAKKSNQECDYDYLYILTSSGDSYWIS